MGDQNLPFVIGIDRNRSHTDSFPLQAVAISRVQLCFITRTSQVSL